MPKKGARKLRPEDINDADLQWLQIATGREYHTEIATRIVSCSPASGSVQYMGAYLIPLVANYADKWFVQGLMETEEKNVAPGELDKYHLDIVYLDNEVKPRFNGDRVKPSETYSDVQSRFPNLETFAKIRRPEKGMIGAYFFGEMHDGSGFIHWNLAFLEKERMVFFDPALDLASFQTGAVIQYNFKSASAITDAFDVQKCIYMPFKRPQWVCISGREDTDIFCQSWVFVFLDIYCNKLVPEFLDIDFEKWKTEIVKSWIYCFSNKDASLRKIMPAKFKYLMRDGEMIKLNTEECKMCAQMVIDRFGEGRKVGDANSRTVCNPVVKKKSQKERINIRNTSRRSIPNQSRGRVIRGNVQRSESRGRVIRGNVQRSESRRRSDIRTIQSSSHETDSSSDDDDNDVESYFNSI